MEKNGSTSYRSDIDGLRAIAVLAVIGFHFFPGSVKGGFIGVDVFFVISGFLISGLMFGQLENNRFSFLDFYSRRIRRIFPALMIVLAASLFLGWIALFPEEFKLLGKHIAAGAGFSSNLVLWGENNYFDVASDKKPLLHLWSLGVEEQFYIMWPLVLWIGKKFRLDLLLMTLGLASVSLGLNIYLVNINNNTAAYYAPYTRFWELSAGSLLAYILLYKENLSKRWPFHLKKKYSQIPDLTQHVFSTVGFCLIVVGVFFIAKDRSLYGLSNLFPVVGAVLIIASDKEAWLNQILSSRILAWIGLISYPLYLWHWPLLTFTRIVEKEMPSILTRLVLILISILLAWLTFELVEKPIRFGEYKKIKTIILLIAMVVIGSVGYSCFVQNGLSSRAVVKMNAKNNALVGMMVLGIDKYVRVDCGILTPLQQKLVYSCERDVRGNITYALIGDSKAHMLRFGLMRTSLPSGRYIFMGGVGGVPVLTDDKSYVFYQDYTHLVLDLLSRIPKIKTVVLLVGARSLNMLPSQYIGNDTSLYEKNYRVVLAGLTKTLAVLIQSGKKVVIVEDTPTLPPPEDCVQRITSSGFINRALNLEHRVNTSCYLKLSSHYEITKRYRELLTTLESRFPGRVKVFYTTKYMCDEAAGVCPPSKHGIPLYGYVDHMSDYASGLIGEDLNKLLTTF